VRVAASDRQQAISYLANDLDLTIAVGKRMEFLSDIS
jgi:hypothetical protein